MEFIVFVCLIIKFAKSVTSIDEELAYSVSIVVSVGNEVGYC